MRRLAKEMEMREEEAMLRWNPSLMVNPISSPMYGAPYASKSAPVFASGLGYGCGVSALHGDSHEEGIEIKFLFSKILTLSDVGKLNRLLIPSQDAERYFPMALEAMDDDGVSFLSFEDSSGVIWHFRYSFWKSSKTYVLTRGWMNFVKENRLNVGDIVSFYQDAGEVAGINRRFIGFTKLAQGSSMPPHVPATTFHPFGTLNDSWLREAFGSSSFYRADLAWKHMSYGSGGTTPPNKLISQPPHVPQGVSLGSSMGPAKKSVKLFGVYLNISSHIDRDESCPCHGCTDSNA